MEDMLSINENFRFRRVDEHSWAFEVRKVAKKTSTSEGGKERWEAKGYSSTLPSTLRIGAAWLVENGHISPPALELLTSPQLKSTLRHREAYRDAVAKTLEAIAGNIEAEQEAAE